MYLTSSATNSSDATVVNADMVSAVTISTLRGSVTGSGQVLVTILAGESRVKFLAPGGTTVAQVFAVLQEADRRLTKYQVVDQDRFASLLANYA